VVVLRFFSAYNEKVTDQISLNLYPKNVGDDNINFKKRVAADFVCA
jgi:hypothetical protein